MIIIDNAGYQFIDSANESDLFTKAGKEINFFDFDSDKEGNDYIEQIKKAKRLYNKEKDVICFKQVFTSNFIRKANEHLQACVDHKRIWFASKTTASDSLFNKTINQHIPLSLTGSETLLDLVETQDDFIYQTKKQCALVEVKSTARGTQTFDLPQHLKRSTSANRARKDNYTTLMLSNWALKSYYDMKNFKSDDSPDTFAPIMLH